jgi:hypothetical protein
MTRPQPDPPPEGICLGLDPAIFHPERGESANPAKRVCAECPVAAKCLDYALRHGESRGVWGGKTALERRKMRRGRLVPA